MFINYIQSNTEKCEEKNAAVVVHSVSIPLFNADKQLNKWRNNENLMRLQINCFIHFLWNCMSFRSYKCFGVSPLSEPFQSETEDFKSRENINVKRMITKAKQFPTMSLLIA